MNQKEFDEKYYKCQYCDGTGYDQILYQDYIPTENDICPRCEGSGSSK